MRTNNPLERLNRECEDGGAPWAASPDRNSALMLWRGGCRYVASTRWRTRRYLDMRRRTEPAKANQATDQTTDQTTTAK
jgi:hypothetical protein